MNLSPISFKRVEAMRPMNYNQALADAYLKVGKRPERVEVAADKISINYPNTDVSEISEFDDKGNMKTRTIYKYGGFEGDFEEKKYIYYPELERPAAAILYKPGYRASHAGTKIKEISLYSRQGEETHNLNYEESKAKINGKDYRISQEGEWFRILSV